MKSKVLSVYFAVSLIELIAVAMEAEKVQWLFKPLIMIVLGIYYYNQSAKDGLLSKPVMVAIIFSWLGDVSLMFQHSGEIYFMIGLGSFLIAHTGYILAYPQYIEKETGNGLHGIQKFRFSFPIVLAGTGLITILYAHLGSLQIPVIVYAVVLVIMTLQALFRYGYTNAVSFWFVFIGALLFMISDSLIAVNKFLSPFELSGVAIMTTYILAQFLIVRGLLFHFERNKGEA